MFMCRRKGGLRTVGGAVGSVFWSSVGVHRCHLPGGRLWVAMETKDTVTSVPVNNKQGKYGEIV